VRTEKEIRKQLKLLESGFYDNWYKGYESGDEAKQEVIRALKWVLGEI